MFGMMDVISQGTEYMIWGGLLQLHKVLVRLHLEYCDYPAMWKMLLVGKSNEDVPE